MIKVEKMIERYSIFETSTFELTLSGIFHVHCWDISSRRWAYTFHTEIFSFCSWTYQVQNWEDLNLKSWNAYYDQSWNLESKPIIADCYVFSKKKHFFIVFGVKLTPSNFQSLWKWTSFRNQQVLCIKYIF